MATVHLTEKNFQETIDNNSIVIVDFWAEWCGPCRSFAPAFEDASEKHSNIIFGKVNTEEERGLAGYFQIRSIPTLLIFKEQIMIYNQPGALQPRDLDDVVEKTIALDMDLVRQKIAEQQ